MKIIDPSGKRISISLDSSPRNNASSLHIKLRQLLHEVYPNTHIVEELYIPQWKVYLDFFLPLFRLACEVDGEQHSEYTPFFHGNDRMNFHRAVARDRKKEEFCEVNSFRLCRFNGKESDIQWIAKLKPTK